MNRSGAHAANRCHHRLLTGLIVSLIACVALCIGAGVALCGLNWYGEQVDGLAADNQKLQETFDTFTDRLAEAEAAREEALTELSGAQSRAEELEGEVSRLEQRLEETQSALAEANGRLEQAEQAMPAYPAGAKLAALTFDEGPNKYTARLLDILKEKETPATFFVLGSWAERYPELIRREVAEGHAVGSHSYSHTKLTTLTAEEIAADLDKSLEALTRITGQTPSLLRVPGGHYNDDVRAYAREKGLRIIQWSVDSRDWEKKNRDSIMENIFESRYNVKDGGIILLHDVHATTVDCVGEIIDRLKAEGYTLVTVPELLRWRAAYGEAGEVYKSLPGTA